MTSTTFRCALHAIGPAEGPPVPPLNLVGDYAGGSMFLAFGLLAGVLRARETGEGQVVDAAMCDAVPTLLSLFHAFSQTGEWKDSRHSNMLDGGAPYYRCYPCRDGKFIAVGALEPQFFREMMSGLGLSANDYAQLDTAQWPALAKAMAERILTKTRDEWAEIFAARDACVTPVLGFAEAPAAPHLAARGVYIEREGKLQAAPAPRFSRDEPVVSAPGRTTAQDILMRWN
jgi:alpha-methylacyl-CoA racemase